MGPRSLLDGTDLHDLDELQIVTKRAFRRGYDGLFHGRPMRLSYARIMDVPGGVLVYRPALGTERPRRVPQVTWKGLLLFAVCAWPATLFVLLFVASIIHLAIRAMLHG